ncbi:MAG TPA: NAD(P)-dependent oxidoreductase [Candidatus Gastranaerophilales bacterium]|nr:NAD(P)-dependent oxidoreductase [Candidatus Gastranaerophilales bacterium]
MAKIKTVFFDIKDFEEQFLLKHAPENCEFILIKKSFQEGFAENFDKIKDAEILSVFTSSNVSVECLKKLPNLKLITTRSTGYNNIDLEYCKTADIKVTNAPGYGECTVAEFTFALLLNVARKVSEAYEELKEGRINLHGSIGIDLFGKTIGIIGTGSIGCYTAKIAYGFGMKILSYDPFPKENIKEKYSVEYVELEELLKNSDIISVHTPSTKENFHMINEDAFNKMKDKVILINTARGEIVDTKALYAALKSGKVAGAGLDVVECEEILTNEEFYLTKTDCVKRECLEKTLINHKLLDMPNVIITPHIAFDTIEAIQRILITTINNINGYLKKEIINRVA